MSFDRDPRWQNVSDLEIVDISPGVARDASDGVLGVGLFYTNPDKPDTAYVQPIHGVDHFAAYLLAMLNAARNVFSTRDIERAVSAALNPEAPGDVPYAKRPN